MTLTLTPPDAPTADPAARFARCVRLVGLDLPFPTLEPATALDGSPGARRDGRWLGGCSVPRRAAELMIRNEAWPARALALVAPPHAQQIDAVLARIGPTRALVVLAPAPADVADLLAVIDFEPALVAGRLHVAWDAASLRAVFARHPGLAVPSQMARLPDADPAAAAAVIAWAQPVFAALTGEHVRRINDAAQRPLPPSDSTADRTTARRRCRVLAGRRFGLWDDAGDTLARVLGPDAAVLDTDLPTAAADAAVAEWVADVDAVIADRPRPAWASPARAWTTWVTRPSAVPAFDARCGRDRLLLADAAWRPLATAAGWPAGRVAVAGWPTDAVRVTPGAPPALVLDQPGLSTPADLDGVTAPRLVWEAVRKELTEDPFALGPDAAAYVARAPGRLGLPPGTDLPVARLVDTLVAPAYALGLARWLARRSVAFTLHGRGWADEADLAAHWRGPVESRAGLHAAVAASGGLIDPTLPNTLPAVAALGVPAVRPFGRSAARVLQDVTALVGGRVAAKGVAGPVLAPSVLGSHGR